MCQLFVDMDGVLADFDRHHASVFGFRPCKIADNVDWAKVRVIADFYFDIPPMPDMRELRRKSGTGVFVKPTPTFLILKHSTPNRCRVWNQRSGALTR